MKSLVFSKPLPLLADEYQRLWDTCSIRNIYLDEVQNAARKVMAGKGRYVQVAQVIGCPWELVGVIHHMEAVPPCSFKQHLHNGDPLTKRTIHDPVGRPRQGNPPFEWHVSAIDALQIKYWHKIRDWSIPMILYLLEAYNGFGYRLYHPEVLSPYLWSFTNYYIKGKYRSDGVWDANLVSAQCGAVPLMKMIKALISPM